jgi:hypothetical protein
VTDEQRSGRPKDRAVAAVDICEMASQIMKDEPEDLIARRITQKIAEGILVRVSASFGVVCGPKNRREDVKNPKNHFRPFCSGNLLAAKPFQSESHKTIFRIFRKIFGGIRGEGSMISPPNPNPNMSPSDNQLYSLFFSAPAATLRETIPSGLEVDKSTQSRRAAKSQSQTRPELPGQIQTDSKRFKAIQTKKKKTQSPAMTKRMTPQSIRAGPQTPPLTQLPVHSRPGRKNQGESSWVKVNQGLLKHFFLLLRQKWRAWSAAAAPARF